MQSRQQRYTSAVERNIARAMKTPKLLEHYAGIDPDRAAIKLGIRKSDGTYDTEVAQIVYNANALKDTLPARKAAKRASTKTTETTEE